MCYKGTLSGLLLSHLVAHYVLLFMVHSVSYCVLHNVAHYALHNIADFVAYCVMHYYMLYKYTV